VCIIFLLDVLFFSPTQAHAVSAFKRPKRDTASNDTKHTWVGHEELPSMSVDSDPPTPTDTPTRSASASTSSFSTTAAASAALATSAPVNNGAWVPAAAKDTSVKKPTQFLPTAELGTHKTASSTGKSDLGKGDGERGDTLSGMQHDGDARVEDDEHDAVKAPFVPSGGASLRTVERIVAAKPVRSLTHSPASSAYVFLVNSVWNSAFSLLSLSFELLSRTRRTLSPALSLSLS
jgi:hypothetical protein